MSITNIQEGCALVPPRQFIRTLGGSLAALGCAGEALGGFSWFRMQFWCQLVPIWPPKMHQNQVLEVSWTLLEPSWGLLGWLGGILKFLGGVFGPLGRILEASWSVLYSFYLLPAVAGGRRGRIRRDPSLGFFRIFLGCYYVYL